MNPGEFRVARLPSGRWCVVTCRAGLFPGDPSDIEVVSNRPLTRDMAVEVANGLHSCPRDQWSDMLKEIVGPRKRKPRDPAPEGAPRRRRSA